MSLPFQRGGGGAAAAGGGLDAGKLGGQTGAVGALAGQAAALGGVGGEAGAAISSVGSSLAALGPIGAVAAVGAVGVGFALKKMGEASEKARREMELQLAAQFAAIDAQEMTTEQIQEQRAALEKEIDLNKQKLAIAEENVVIAEEERSWKEKLGAATTFWSDGMEEAEETAKGLTDDIADADAKMTGLTDGLSSVEVAANDAAAALEEQAEANSDAALDSADIAAKKLKIELDAADRSADANKKRAEQIEKDIAVAEKQLSSLRFIRYRQRRSA